MAHLDVSGVPTVEPRGPEETVARGAYQRIETNPRMFGAGIGEAEQQVGQDLQRVAEQQGGLAAQQAATNYQDQSSQIIQNLRSKRGQDFMDAYGPAMDQIKQLREQGAQNLGLTTSLEKYNDEVRRTSYFQEAELGSLYDQNSKIYNQSVQEGTIASNNRAIASTYNNDALFDATAARNRLAAMDIAKLNGTDQMAAAAEADSKSIVARLEGARAQNDWPAMQRTLDQYGSKLDPNVAAEYGHMAKSLGSAGLGDQAFARINAEISGTPAPTSGPGASGNVIRPRELVPHTPSADFLGATGMSAGQYDTFRRYLAGREAGSYAERPNPGGFMGQYQMGTNEIQETAGRLGEPVPTQQQFLSNPQLQERFFENYTLEHHNELMASSAQYRNASPAERAAILAGAHLGGPGHVQEYLNGQGNAADSNGTRVGTYVTEMRQAQGQASTATAGAGGPNLEIWGDSLGVGLNAPHGGALGAPGHVHGGDTPTTIFNQIKEQPETHWEGKTVVLPSGSNGNEMPVVEETIQYLKSNGANVIAVGYGPKFPEKNAELQQIAQRQGVPVIGAEGVGQEEGVHPSPQGYASMARKISATVPPQQSGAPDQLAGQSQAAAPAPATPTTPISRPPGWQQLGDEEAANAQWFARMQAGIEGDPQLANDPVAEARALGRAKVQFESKQALIAAQRQQLVNNRNAALGDYLKELPPGQPAPPDLWSRITADPRINIDPDALKYMRGIIDSSTKRTADGEAATYGPGTFDVTRRMLLPAGNPDRISDVSQILSLGIPNAGTTWLTAQGVSKAKAEFDAIRSHPETAESMQRLEEFFSGFRSKIDKSGMLPGLPNDQNGAIKFYEFKSMVRSWWDAYRETPGKNPEDLITPGKPEYLGKTDVVNKYTRSITQALADRSKEQQETGAAPGKQAFAPNAPTKAPDLAGMKSLAELQAAVKTDPSLYYQAIAIAKQKGFIGSNEVPAAPPPPPPALNPASAAPF